MVKLNGNRYCENCFKKMKDKYANEIKHNYKWDNRKFCPTCNKVYENDREYALSMDKHLGNKEGGAYYKEFSNKYKNLKLESIKKNIKK